jgi:outer membrane protein assembly factor BamB
MATSLAAAEDWPEWRGRGRAGVWREQGIMEQFPEGGLRVTWRVPVRAGWSGPAVAGGRVFVTDYDAGQERALCLEEKTGKIVWTREWPAEYRGMAGTYATGPRATPTVDGDHVYVLGASGVLYCLNARTGEALWRKEYLKDFEAPMPVWGMAAAPLVDGARLIVVTGGPRGVVAALDKLTGRLLWQSVPGNSEPGYSQPVLAGGRVLVWHPLGLAMLDPQNGKVEWERPFKIHLNLVVATPVVDAGRVLVSAFYNGSLAAALDGKELWRGKSNSEIKTDGLHALISTPVIDGDYIYGICSYGQLRCLDARTGERMWETLAATGEQARWATGHIVRHGDRYFINNDRGELILARLSPKGYEEIDRTKLIEPTSNPGNRRAAGAVNWTHPAYANGHVITRNDREAVRLSLER